MLMMSGGNEGRFAGICTFTWYRPVNPGVKPEKTH